MFNFTTQTVYNAIATSGANKNMWVASNSKKPALRIGNTRFDKDDILDIQVKNPTVENLASVEFDLSSIIPEEGEVTARIALYIGLSMNSQDSLYANDYVYKGKPLFVEFYAKSTDSADVLANRVKAIADKYMLFIKDKYKDEKVAGEIKTYVKGGKAYGELLFSRLKIPSASFGKTDKKLFVYIVISQKSGSNTKVKVDLYPYNLTNNVPLAPNEIFAEKIPAETQDFQLVLMRNDIDYNQDVKITIIRPSSDKYSIGMGQSEGITNKKIKETETGIKRSEKNELGKREISLYPKEKRYIFLNIYANQYELEEKDDLVVFRYKNTFSEDSLFYLSKPVFEVEGTKNNITFRVSDVQPTHSSTGKAIFIFNAYKASDITDIKTDDEYKPLYLFFSDKTPAFQMYKVTIESDKKIRTFTTTAFDYSGDFYFACTVVIEDNEKEEYLAFAGVPLRVGSSDYGEGLLDYILNHLLTAIIIGIIALLIIGMMINICRAERGNKGRTTVKLDSIELKEIASND